MQQGRKVYTLSFGKDIEQKKSNMRYYADKSMCSNEEVYAWLAENAYQYGFILRYPPGKQEITGTSYEPWHYRYVGEEAAREIYERGICLEEYFE